MAKANLNNDTYFLKLVSDEYFSVSTDGVITNNKTKNVIGAKQKGIDYIGVRHKSKDGVMHCIQAHRLVWLVHAGPIVDDSLVVNHKDLNKRNNRFDNLELITGLANTQHALPFKKNASGEEVHNAAFTNAEVAHYRSLWENNKVTVKQISEEKQVSIWTVRDMLKRNTYKYI